MTREMGATPARVAALEVLVAVEARDAYAGLALDAALDTMDIAGRDRAFATELVYGVLRWRERLDWVLSRFMKRPIGSLDPRVRNALRIGLYQLMFLGNIPARAAIHQSVELVKLRGGKGRAGFVNAVLRAALRGLPALRVPGEGGTPGEGGGPGKRETQDYRLSVYLSHPRWLVERWIRQFGFEATKRLCEINNTPAPLSIRANTLKVTREDLIRLLGEEGVSCSPSPIVPEGVRVETPLPISRLESFRQGLFIVQDEAAMLVSHVVSPAPDSFVIDAASAPGGKATHLASLMHDKGRVIAADIHPHRLRLVRENSERMGITCIETVLCDARELPVHFKNAASHVLIDAPCSATGVLRRRPDVKWRRRPEQIEELARLQSEIISAASECVAPGGILVYSTCSLEHEENEDVVLGFLESHPQFTLLNARERLPAEFLSAFP
ncbi:MAG TPA: 16S rRNA (cytosine(967)-C(5))-methyltransferase RsmB, partial [Firmicutes bacterium]|nr:16S rRNA (cytosine(967)-C(5))-methyltransferase RsmB [Bacillota bacterium]